MVTECAMLVLLGTCLPSVPVPSLTLARDIQLSVSPSLSHYSFKVFGGFSVACLIQGPSPTGHRRASIHFSPVWAESSRGHQPRDLRDYK